MDITCPVDIETLRLARKKLDTLDLFTRILQHPGSSSLAGSHTTGQNGKKRRSGSKTLT